MTLLSSISNITDMKTLLWSFILLIVLLIILYPNRPIGVQARQGIKTITPAYPLVGNLPWIYSIISKRTRILDEIYRLQHTQAQGGQPFTLTFPALGGRVTVINNPAYLHHVQKTNFDNYPKGPDQRRIMADVLGIHGIFASDGEIWLKQRKLASQIFSVNNFRTHVQSTVVQEIEILDKLLEDTCRTQTCINFPDVMFRFTLNSFALMAFAADMNCLPPSVEGLSIPNEFAMSFDFAQMVMDHRIFSLVPKWSEWFTREGYNMRKAMKSLNGFCLRIIDKRLANRENEKSGNATDKSGKDLLDLFIAKGLNREELLPVILNFLIAGRDTTAQSLAWMFYELFKEPKHIKTIRNSLLPVLGSPEEQKPLQFDQMKELPYLHACFYEAVRLWPAVPKNLKRVVNSDLIIPSQSDGCNNLPAVDVRAGETVIWSDWCMARMPEIWGPDCSEFHPERFLETDTDGKLRVKEFSPFKFNSFNAGPRMCLGKTLATYEGMAVAAAIIGRYDVIYDDHQMNTNPPTYQDSLTLPCTSYFVQMRPFRDDEVAETIASFVQLVRLDVNKERTISTWGWIAYPPLYVL